MRVTPNQMASRLATAGLEVSLDGSLVIATCPSCGGSEQLVIALEPRVDVVCASGCTGQELSDAIADRCGVPRFSERSHV